MGSFLDHSFEFMEYTLGRIKDESVKSVQLRNMSIGVAAITLDCAREDKLGQRGDIQDETNLKDCVDLIYQIRNAFAHGMTEPIWLPTAYFQRVYNFENFSIDLQDKREQYVDIEGEKIVEMLYCLRKILQAEN